MSAGDFMRRAVGNVSNTIAQASSTVTSVAQGRKRYDISDDAMEKCTLTIKCTPNKDAQTTTALSIKSGYLMKRNEQGQWQKRYICTVPHLFLYYFDSDAADSPRGVIDLELYTNITRHKNTLKAATNNEEKMRAFHFMSDDDAQLNDWLAHFMRDRYFAVCEERNAYQQMQSEMTAVLDTISCQTKAVEIDKEIVEKQLQEALLAKQEAIGVLQSMLTIVGITEEEMSRLYDLNRIGQCLQTAIIRLQKEVEMKFYGPDEVLEAEKAARAEEVQELHEKIELEIRARKNLEAMLLKQKKSTELQNAEYSSQIDTHLLNFQMMVASKADADEKNASLAEQRRLLIKEVKRARSKLSEAENSLEQVESVNSKLTSAVSALQTELIAMKRDLEEQKKQAKEAQEESERRHQAAISAAVVAALDAVKSGASEGREKSVFSSTEDSSGSEDSALLPVPAPISLSAESFSIDAQDTVSISTETTKDASETTQNVFISPREVELLLLESQAIVSKLQPVFNNVNRQRRTSSGSGSGTATPPGSLSTSNSDTNLALSVAERRHSADSGSGATPQTPMDLKELGWLSPEQERLVDSRIQLHQQQRPAVEAQYKYLESSDRTATTDKDKLASAGAAAASIAVSASTSTESETPSAASLAASSASAAASSTFSMFSGAMSMLSSTATATLHSATGQEETITTVSNAQKRSPKGIISSIFQSEREEESSEGVTQDQDEVDDPERLPSAMRLNCLRCSGTVEGPKYSTCKCSVPALVPEDLQPASSFSTSSTGSWGFSMLSKSSSAFVGGLAKASQVTQHNVESLMKVAKGAQQAPNESAASSSAATKDKNTEGFLFYNSMVSAPAPAGDAPAGGEAETASHQEIPPEQDLWNYFVGKDTKKSEDRKDSAKEEERESISVERTTDTCKTVHGEENQTSEESKHSLENPENNPEAIKSKEGTEIPEERQAGTLDIRPEEESIYSGTESNTAFI